MAYHSVRSAELRWFSVKLPTGVHSFTPVEQIICRTTPLSLTSSAR